MCYHLLDWDSNFFGMPVARITDPSLSIDEVSELLGRLRLGGVRLVYWPAARRQDEAEVGKLGGLLADAKTTFAVDLQGLDPAVLQLLPDVEPYHNSMPIADLESLAVQCGEYSRFAVDARVPHEKFVELYQTWMRRSLRKNPAGEVLVIRKGPQIAGVVTLGEKHGRGDIGLIAVDRNFRGRRFAERLVRAAQRWFIEHGYKTGQVVTQGRNVPACKLYQKCGYSVEKVEYFYHFWLGEIDRAAGAST